ncbi:MAG TPA: hypothetical protein VF824_05440 [Thermoanaerobaculia bacterium]
MSSVSYGAAEPSFGTAEVEVIDWAPRWSFWGVAADFARVQILLNVFDGDPDKWLSLIARNGSDDDGDLPFLTSMKERLADDPSYLDDLRRLVREFAERFGTD